MFAGKLLVHLAKSINLIVDAGTLLSVKEDLDNLVAVLLGADTLSDDLSGVDEVREDSVVDSGESAGPWSLLGHTAAARRKREDTTLRDEEDVTIGEFLLEFTGESGIVS